jgi:hypothetical protein
VRLGTIENPRRREKGLFPQPEFQLVIMHASWSPSDPEIPAPEAGSDPMTEFGT